MIAAPVIGPEPLAGIADAVKLARGALDALSSDRRISETARKQLQIALDSLAASLKSPAQSPADFAVRLSNLKRQSEALPELARALFEEGDSDVAGIADVVTWTEAVVSSVQCHQRDVDGLLPWIHLTAGEAVTRRADFGRSAGSLSDID